MYTAQIICVVSYVKDSLTLKADEKIRLRLMLVLRALYSYKSSTKTERVNTKIVGFMYCVQCINPAWFERNHISFLNSLMTDDKLNCKTIGIKTLCVLRLA